MIIRQARIDEVETLAALGLSFIQNTRYPTLEEATLESLEKLMRLVFSLGDDGCILVAESETGVHAGLVGGLVIVKVAHPITGVDYADEVGWWVEPGYRDSMVGPKLLYAAERWTLAKGLKMLKMVAPVPSRVGRFLDARGFRAVETAYVKVLTDGSIHDPSVDRFGSSGRSDSSDADQ